MQYSTILKTLFTIYVTIHACLGNAPKITEEDFNEAVVRNDFSKPDPDIYPIFVEAVKDFDQEELGMFLAQVIYQSGGFQFREDILCSFRNQCAGRYVDNVGLPGKSYYGRGFMKLTWATNYKAVSQDLGLGDLLLDYPELVATDTKYAVLTSVWYWKNQVRPKLVKDPNEFGITTKAIDGINECVAGEHEQAAMRYTVYTTVANVLNIKDKAVENGCYN